MFWRTKHPFSEDDLSAFADGSLDEARSAELRAHVQTCSACSDAVAELEVLRGALSALPKEPVPRSFVVRAEDVNKQPARPAPTQGLLGSMTPILSGVAAIALVAFLVLAGVDVASNSSSNGVEISRNAVAGSAAPEADNATGGPERLSGAYDAQQSTPPAPTTGEAPLPLPQAGEDGDQPTPDIGAQVEDGASAPATVSPVIGTSDHDMALRVGEIAAAAVALAAAGGAFAFWRRSRQLG